VNVAVAFDHRGVRAERGAATGGSHRDGTVANVRPTCDAPAVCRESGGSHRDVFATGVSGK